MDRRDVLTGHKKINPGVAALHATECLEAGDLKKSVEETGLPPEVAA